MDCIPKLIYFLLKQEVIMKKRIAKKIFSAVLTASMILGNVGLPQGLGEVRAAQADIDSIIDGKTLVT